MNNYAPRIVDAELDELLTGISAISLEGPRAVGKTATALRRVTTVHNLDDATQLQIAQGEPSRLITGEAPVLIDEWQRLPSSWDLVRRAVDQDPMSARFLLTGSAAPAEAPTHSGAGRIVTVRMRPMSLAERGLTEPTVSMSALLSGRKLGLEGVSHLGVADYADEIVGSGFPAIRTLSGRQLRSQLDGYVARIVEHDFDDLGRSVRDKTSLRRWLTAYAAAVSTVTSFRRIHEAATPGENDRPAKSTALRYRTALENLWMIDEVPAWLPTKNRLRRLAAAPVHQLADPALAARLLGVDASGLVDGADPRPGTMRDGTLFGALFESLVTLSVRVYAQANEARVAHLRTRAGEHEIDLIIERADGKVVALEVKLSALVDDRDVRHLRWLGDRIGPDLLDAVVITTGAEAYRRPDGIGVVPASLLTA